MSSASCAAVLGRLENVALPEHLPSTTRLVARPPLLPLSQLAIHWSTVCYVGSLCLLQRPSAGLAVCRCRRLNSSSAGLLRAASNTQEPRRPGREHAVRSIATFHTFIAARSLRDGLPTSNASGSCPLSDRTEANMLTTTTRRRTFVPWHPRSDHAIHAAHCRRTHLSLLQRTFTSTALRWRT